MFENNVSDPNGWSLGKSNNLREVFGELQQMLKVMLFINLIFNLTGNSVCSWLIPIKSSIGDGLSFPSRNMGGDIPDYTCAGESIHRH